MPSTIRQVWNIQLNLGELVELFLVFQESVVQELVEMVKVLSEICVEKVECLHQSESGEDGTEELTLSKRDML